MLANDTGLGNDPNDAGPGTVRDVEAADTVEARRPHG